VSISPMLPIRDVDAFGGRLVGLNADEYVTQFLKPGRSKFAGASSGDTRQRLRDDGWGIKQYQEARRVLAGILGPSRPLLEGAEGYAPA
jgi:hypothetical protein